MAAALPWIVGGAGLLQQREQQRKQNQLNDQAQAQNAEAMATQKQVTDIQLPALRHLAELAAGYDPKKEGFDAVSAATPVFNEALKKSLSEYNAGSDVSPGNSTESQVKQTEAISGATEPFKQAILQALANPTLKRMQALEMVAGQPAGNLVKGYFDGANNSAGLAGLFRPDFSGPSSILSQALQQLMAKGGAGGTGDRYTKKNLMADSAQAGVERQANWLDA